MAISALRPSPFNHRFTGCSSIADYEVLSKLGEGTFGEVHKARSQISGKVVALKKILMHNEKDGFPVTAIREIKLLKMLSHVNILALVEMAVERPHTATKDSKKKAIMYMVTPYMEHDLSGLLTNPNVKFTEPQIKCYMLQLLEGLKYLHNSQILHRDMKAANLLISNQGILQIADFGLARHYDEAPPSGAGSGYPDAKRDYTALVVTRWYRPPELLLGLRRYTPAIDLWGVGCVFGEMYKRVPILQGSSDLAQAQMIFDLVGSPTEDNMPGWSSLPGCESVKEFETSQSKINQTFRDLSASACSLLSDLLRLNWRKRITAMSALQHPYFRAQPFPAKPHELPTFEDSHELDHRRSKGQKGPPPAPAGGTVGMGSQAGGEWAGPGAASQADSQQYGSRPGSQDNRIADRGGDLRRSAVSTQTTRQPPVWATASSNSVSSQAVVPLASRAEKDSYVPSYAQRPLQGSEHTASRDTYRQRPRERNDHDRYRDDPRWDHRGRDHYDRGDRSNVDVQRRDRHERAPRDREPRSYEDRPGGLEYEDGRRGASYSDRSRRTTRSRSPDRARHHERDREWDRERPRAGYSRP